MGFFQFVEFFLFFLVGGPLHLLCFYKGWGRIGGEIFYIHNLNLDTSHSLNALSRLPVQTNIASNLNTVILLSCQQSPQGKHKQVSDKSKGYCLKLFGVMLREMSILFIRYPRNKIHSWHVVDQVLSQGSASDPPVANMGPKCLFN